MQKISNLTQGQVLWLLHDRQPLIPSYATWVAGIQWVMAPTSKLINVGYIEVQYFSETNTYQVAMEARTKPVIPEVISRVFDGGIEDCFKAPVYVYRPSIWFRNTNLNSVRAEFKNENLDFITYDPQTRRITTFIAVNVESVGTLGETKDPTA